MSQDDRDFERFSRTLDHDWLRQRLVSVLPPPGAIGERDLLAGLVAADPLGGSPRPGWLTALREALAVWPGRLALAGAAAALLVAGVLIGRLAGPAGPAAVATAVPPRPGYDPGAPARPGLGIGAPVAPASQERFREAMRFSGEPDFPAKAVPLLRAAVAADASNDQAQFWLGVALLLDRRGAEAVAPLEAAVRLAPGDSRYKQYLLFAYLQIGAVDKALTLQTDILRRP